jgi:hypothetical protein
MFDRTLKPIFFNFDSEISQAPSVTLEPDRMALFPSLVEFTVAESNVAQLDEELFLGNQNLTKISLTGNSFSALPELLFSHTPLLEDLLVVWSHSRYTHFAQGTARQPNHDTATEAFPIQRQLEANVGKGFFVLLNLM